MAKSHVPSDLIATVIGKPGANATRPSMGRFILMTRLDFTMKLFEEYVADGQRCRTVNSLYSAVKPLRQYCLSSLHRAHNQWPTRPSPEDRTRWRFSRPTPRRRSPLGLLPRGWSRRSLQRCRSRPACGVRSSRRGLSATSSRVRSNRRAINLRDGLTSRARAPCHRPPRRLFSSSR